MEENVGRAVYNTRKCFKICYGSKEKIHRYILYKSYQNSVVCTKKQWETVAILLTF